MTVGRWQDPNFTTMSAAAYKAALDAAFGVVKRQGDWFAPHQVYSGSPNPDLAVELDAGWILNGITLTEKTAQTVSGFTIPTAGQHRIDRVVVDASTGAATRVAGTAVTGSPSAVAPAIPAGKLPNCQVLITSSDTAVLNAMITDERAFPTSGGTAASQAEVDAGTSTTVFLAPSNNRITLGTEVASTSGASIDFTGIPSGTRRITILGRSVSTNGTSMVIAQLGDAGGIETSGYLGGGGSPVTGYTSTSGLVCYGDMSAVAVIDFRLVIDLENAAAFRWIGQSMGFDNSAAQPRIGLGSKATSQELDRVRITTVGGTDTFDAGVINICYER